MAGVFCFYSIYLFIASTKLRHMKKIFTYLLFIAIVPAGLTLTGCKKAASVDGHVLTQTEAYTANGQTTNTVTTFSYDDQGRQVLASPTAGTPTTTSYSSSSIVQTTGASVTTYQLNSKGQAVSDNNGYTYTYDNNGYLITISQNSANSQVNTISGGNVTGEVINNNGQQTTLSFSYGTDKDYRNTGVSFLGKNNTNLATAATYASGQTTVTYVIAHTFDSKGRVLTETITGGGTSDVYTYTYTTN